MQKIYIELILLDNFLMDALLLGLTMRFSRRRLSWGRVFLGAFIGAIYAFLSLILSVLGSFPVKIAVSVLMCLTVCPIKPARPFLRTLTFFYGLSFLMGGAVLAAAALSGKAIGGASINLPILRILLPGALAGLFVADQLARRHFPIPTRCYTLLGQFRGEAFTLTALLDTGNRLTDPWGRSVIIAKKQPLLDQLSPELQQTLCSQNSCSLLLEFSTIAGSGQLIAFMPDSLLLCCDERTWNTKAYIALSDKLTMPGCSAILGQRLTLTVT
ncbi:MAG: sigma-E processing peptidase SpoIIGA [Christensenellaceae bacterium]|nr:sigma-E processing peptidase SpoIIGA [Christensenellaceae bacterium]